MAREMKDSGIEWIGKIPQKWDIKKGKWILKLLERPITETDGVITCFRNGEVTLRSKRREEGFTISLKEIGYQGIDEGDLVVHGMDGFAGAIGISDSRGKGSPVLNVLGSDQCKKYIMYYLRSMAYNGIFLALSTGIRVRSCDTNWNKLKELLYILPKISEQQLIANFLDTQCAHIDSVIEKTRAAIEEYKKLKQAVITQAVTKGIRPNREIKDSGIEWVGEIPAEWNVQRIKTIFSLRDERNYLPLEEVNLISLYTDKGVVQHSDLEKTTGNKASNADGYKIVCENDIIVNIILCWMGAIGRSDYQGVTSPAYDIYVPSNTIECRFYHHYFRTKGFSGDCYKRGKGIMAMRWRTYSDQFRDIKVVVPPLEEQQEILKHLDEKTAAIDSLIQKKEQLITELESYKKSLIYEYVTGKKEVKADITVEYSPEFKKALLMCRILELTQCKGRIHLQKTFFAIDTLLNLFSTQYYRFEHGPYDLDIESYEKNIEENGWLNIYVGKSIRYNKTNTFSDYFREYEKVFGDRDDIIQRICKVFNVPRTTKAEKIATLLAVWNDFLINGIEPTDDMIIDDVITNWTPNKANVSRETWSEFISKIRENNIVPKGYGKHTKRMEELVNGKKL